MSFYDIVMIALFGGSVLFGLWKGLVWQIAAIASIFVSYMVAMNFREPVSQYIQAEEPWNKIAAMLVLFLGTSLLIWIVFGRVKETIKKVHLKTFDRQVGAMAGAGTGALLCMVVTMFSVTLLGDSAKSAIFDSKTGGYITAGIDSLTSVVPDEIHQVIKPQLDKYYQAMGDQPESNTDQSGSFTGGYPAQPVGYGQQNGQPEQPNGYNGTFQPYQPNTSGYGTSYNQSGSQYGTNNYEIGQPRFPNQYEAQTGGTYQNQNNGYQYPNNHQSSTQGQYGSAGTGQGDEFQWPEIKINTKDLLNGVINTGIDRLKKAVENGGNQSGNN